VSVRGGSYDGASFHELIRKRGIDNNVLKVFRQIVYAYYERNARKFPWRNDALTPYHVFVSEIMLQQTQAERVAQKYPGFIALFPDFSSLALTPLEQLLRAWQGLGYNRRALALRRSAEIIINRHSGLVPNNADELKALPGIGHATASSILAFAFNKPVVFIETNIRAVYIHLFFKDRADVADGEILPLVERSLDRKNPRRWYNALMDYGVMLKSIHHNPARRSKHYKKQSVFHGSHRQKRSTILKMALDHPGMSARKISTLLNSSTTDANEVLAELVDEGFLFREHGRYFVR
jgi:A/G-specific adenine glycosylase